MEYIEAFKQLFIEFKKPYDSVRKEALYNIFNEFGLHENGKANTNMLD